MTDAFVSTFHNHAFVGNARPMKTPPFTVVGTTTSSTTSLFFFGKLMEEEGPLGKGITVGKIQVALQLTDRSLIKDLERKARTGGTSPFELSNLCNDVCLTLLRMDSSWTAACSESFWFSEKDEGKAERKFNTFADTEAAKFEKEYIPKSGNDDKPGGPTLAVVSLILELQGDETEFDGAGFSMQKTKEILTCIASDCKVEGGTCLNAVEVFWTPGERDEILTSLDVVSDFPELIDL